MKRAEGSLSPTVDQSPPHQVVVQIGGPRHYRSSSPPNLTHSRSNSLSDRRSFEPLTQSSKTRSTPALDILRSVHNQLDESEKVLSDLTKELTLTQEALALKRRSVEHSTSATGLEKISPEPLPVPNCHQEAELSLEESDSVSLEALIETELLLNSDKSPPVDLPLRSPSLSSSTPSDVSTIVPRDLVPSRCSAVSLPEDQTTSTDGQTHNTSSREPQVLSTAAPPPTPVTADSEGFTNPLSNTSPDGREFPESNPFEGPTIEYSGSQTLFRNHSPVVDIDAILSDLSPGEYIGEEPILLFTVSAPSPLPGEASHNLSLSSDEGTDLAPHLNHVSEEGEQEGDPPSQDIDFLEVSPQSQQRPHPTVTALKEDWRKSFHSSSSSLDSTACSVIEVSYCYSSAPGDSDEVSSSHSPPQQDSTEANTSSCYSSSSEPEADGTSYEVVPAETLNHHLASVSIPDPAEEGTTCETSTESKNFTRYHSLPNFEQADLEPIPEEMAVTTQVMRIYPAQSVGEISSSVTVPHHRVHIPSSATGPESPSKCTEQSGNIVCVSPSTPTPSDESDMKVVREGSSVQVVEPPGLMAATIQILEDGEEEEEEDEVNAQPVAPKNRKISGVSMDSHTITLF